MEQVGIVGQYSGGLIRGGGEAMTKQRRWLLQSLIGLRIPMLEERRLIETTEMKRPDQPQGSQLQK